MRKDPTERALRRCRLHFDRVFVAQPLSDVNVRRLERELVLAYETGAAVTVVLTKADLAESDAEVASVRDRVRALAGPDVQTVVVSADDPSSVEAVRALVPPNTTAVLIGKSGVGKSSLINIQRTSCKNNPRAEPRQRRHTTVSREMVAIPGGGFIMDMPGVRGLGLWEADAGIGAAFADIEEAAERCRFRDCSHEDGRVRRCAPSGDISRQRYASYRALRQETKDLRARREEARRMRGEKASDRGKTPKKGRPRKKR